MMRPMPKSVIKYVTRHPEKFDEGWLERDCYDGDAKPWSVWLYLKYGWANTEVDCCGGMHIIHESSAREVIRQYRLAKPCDCIECKAHLAKRAAP